MTEKEGNSVNAERRSPMILIAEDEPPNLQLLVKVLRKEEYRIAMAGNGRQALELAPNIMPDLILLDVGMPEMNGFEVCKRLKESPATRDIPVIFLTAKTEDNFVVEGLHAGAVDYVKKPFNATELLARVRTHVEFKRSKDEVNELKGRLAELTQALGGQNGKGNGKGKENDGGAG